MIPPGRRHISTLLTRCWLTSGRGGASLRQVAKMARHEYIRLRHHYEAALRHRGHVFLSSGAEPIGARARLAAEIKQKAFEERNAAYERMCIHEKTCPVCNPKLNLPGPRGPRRSGPVGEAGEGGDVKRPLRRCGHVAPDSSSQSPGLVRDRRAYARTIEEIEERIDGGQTALCLHRGIDSVLPVLDGQPDVVFLRVMHRYWF
jgi:hypothetical protein